LIDTQLQVLVDNLTGGKSFFNFAVYHAATASHASVDHQQAAMGSTKPGILVTGFGTYVYVFLNLHTQKHQ